MKISFFVVGTPRPGGSKRFLGIAANGKAKMADACKGNKAWRSQVAKVAAKEWPESPTSDPLFVRFQFMVVRPKSHYGTGKHSTRLRTDAPAYPCKRPDVLKYARSTEDAMTGIVYADDAATVVLYAEKRFSDVPGCLISIERMADVSPGQADVTL